MSQRGDGGGRTIEEGHAELTVATHVYPVGSLYMSLYDINPYDVLDYGVWEKIATNLYLTSK